MNNLLFMIIICDYGSFSEEIFNNHNETIKHKRICGK